MPHVFMFVDDASRAGSKIRDESQKALGHGSAEEIGASIDHAVSVWVSLLSFLLFKIPLFPFPFAPLSQLSYHVTIYAFLSTIPPPKRTKRDKCPQILFFACFSVFVEL